MKFYKNLVDAISNSLFEVLCEEKYTDRVVSVLLKSNPKWGSRDRSFIAENIYDIVRYQRLILHISKISTIDKDAIYSIIGTWFLYKYNELPKWDYFESINQESVLEAINNKESFPLAIKESYPDWLDTRLTSEIGEKWNTEAISLNEKAKVVLRVNTFQISKEKLQQLLQDDEIETSIIDHPDYNDALVLNTRKNILANQWFRKGYFEIQDAGSQLIAPYLNVKPGMFIIDACAGGGGKALHLASLMENKGRIIAMDVEEWKLKNLRERAKRAGITIIETQLISNRAVKRLANQADAILLDVPCSGVGVIKRNPDTKWKLSEEMMEGIIDTQSTILSKYSLMLKSNGKLVYATCSILPSENENVITNFTNKNTEFLMEKEQTIYPSEGFDGFYMACLTKK